jgi:catechol 2,3-dioxygenase-like lactoylglutathione lyase family enzyme
MKPNRNGVCSMRSPIQSKMNTVFIHVSNLERSVVWYSRLLGQEFNKENISPPVFNLTINGNTGLTLDAGPNNNKEINPNPHPLFNLHTEDIHSAHMYVKGLNYDIDSQIISFDDFSFFNVKDPDGNIIMVCTG